MRPIRFVAIYLLFAYFARAQNNPVPFVNQPTAPTAAVPGAPGFTLTVYGAGFVPGSVVYWDGTALATSFIRSAQLTATVLATDIASPRTAMVTVHNPAPGGAVSNVIFFPVATPISSLQFTDKSLGITLPATLTSALTADFNHDGKLDLAFFYKTSGGLGTTIALGNGDGTFGPPVRYQGGGPIVGDFNNDGNLDLLGTEQFGSTPDILFGNGDGTFYSGTFYLNGTLLAVGDFNQDGRLDLAGIDYPNLFVALGNGDGTFQETFFAPADSYDGLMVPADFKNDGHLDLTFDGDTAAAVQLYFGNGDGTFSGGSAVPGEVTLFSVADMNGDGIQDVIVIQGFANGGAESYVALGKGDGTFNNGPLFTHSCVGTGVFFGDFNADGKLDMVGTGGCVLLGNGDGTFQTPSAALNTTILAVGDFNGDGRLDLLNLNSSHNLQIALQTPGAQGGDFMLAGTPSSITISSGQTANYSVTVSPTYGFSGTVMLTCGGTPAGSNCTISPSPIVTLTPGSPMTLTVSVLTTASSTELIRPFGGHKSEGLAAWLGLTGMLGLVFLPEKNSRSMRSAAKYRVLFFCLLSVGLTMSACGGGGSSGSSGGDGTPPGTYTLKISGTYTAGSVTLTNSVPLTLVVQ